MQTAWMEKGARCGFGVDIVANVLILDHKFSPCMDRPRLFLSGHGVEDVVQLRGRDECARESRKASHWIKE